MPNATRQVERAESGYYSPNVPAQYLGNTFPGTTPSKTELSQGTCACSINVRVNPHGKDYCVRNKEAGEGKRVVGCQKSLYIETGKNRVFFIALLALNL